MLFLLGSNVQCVADYCVTLVLCRIRSRYQDTHAMAPPALALAAQWEDLPACLQHLAHDCDWLHRQPLQEEDIAFDLLTAFHLTFGFNGLV